MFSYSTVNFIHCWCMLSLFSNLKVSGLPCNLCLQFVFMQRAGGCLGKCIAKINSYQGIMIFGFLKLFQHLE